MFVHLWKKGCPGSFAMAARPPNWQGGSPRCTLQKSSERLVDDIATTTSLVAREAADTTGCAAW
jgi:hypothetical protein